MATIEELRVGCLELRVWLRTAQDHGGVAVKKLGDATTHLDALEAMKEQLPDEYSLGGDGGRAVGAEGVLVSRARALERARAGSASAGDDVPSLRSERMEQARSSARASANAGASGHAEESFQQAAEEALLSQEGLEIERDSLRDRAEDAELALVRAEAEIARLSR
jgi:hypothetical protein